MNTTRNARFQLEINGEPVCVTGIEGLGTMTALVEWCHHDPIKYGSSERIVVHVKGHKRDNPQHFSWHQREVKVGDTITIRVLGPGEVNEALAWSAPHLSPENDNSSKRQNKSTRGRAHTRTGT